MKKEKSNVVVSISIILVSLFLAINLVIDNYEMKCNREIERLMIYNRTTSLFSFSSAIDARNFIGSILTTKNYTRIFAEDKNFVMWIDSPYNNIAGSLNSEFLQAGLEVKKLDDEINHKMVTCSNLSSWGDIFLYLAITFNLFSLYYSIKILRLYKT